MGLLCKVSLLKRQKKEPQILNSIENTKNFYENVIFSSEHIIQNMISTTKYVRSHRKLMSLVTYEAKLLADDTENKN